MFYSKKNTILIAVTLALTVAGCSYRHNKQSPEALAAGSGPGATGTLRNSELSFARVQSDVISPSCTTCHFHSETGNLPLTSYNAVVAHRDDIFNEVFVDHTMPKGSVLTSVQSNLLKAWLAAGAPLDPPAEVTPVVTPTPEPTDVPDPIVVPEPTGTPDPTVTPTPTPTPTQASGIAPTYTSVHANILVPKCIVCHSATSTNPDAEPSASFETYADITSDASWLKAGDPAHSRIIKKATPGASGVPSMPPSDSGIAPLTADELAALTKWVQDGVQNN